MDECFNGELEWTRDRLEGSLDISARSIRGLLMHLTHETLHPGFAHELMVETVTCQVAIELGRYIASENFAPQSTSNSPIQEKEMTLSRRKFNKRAVTFLGGSLLLNPLASAVSNATSRESVVDTVFGKVRGIKQDGGSYSFKGIPYAASTAGKNRFMPPQQREAWAGVRNCFEWGALAPQGASRANPFTGMGEDFAIFFGRDSTVPTTQSEDCLVLNVFTPGLDEGKRPVMVMWENHLPVGMP